MEEITATSDIIKAVKNRDVQEMKSLSNEHKMIFNKMPFLLDELSPQASNLLDKMVQYQRNTNIPTVNKESVFIRHAEKMLDSLKYQRHILHLRQLISERERQNEKDKREIEKFEKELTKMTKELENKPSVDSTQKEIIAMTGKIMNYEKTISDSKLKEEKLGLKPEIMPESLEALIQELDSLQMERDKLKTAADHITIARNSKKDLLKLRGTSSLL